LRKRALAFALPAVTADGHSWYFAYGSNMQSATLRGRRGIEPREFRVGRLAGYSLRFDIPVGPGERGVANLAVDPAAEIWACSTFSTRASTSISTAPKASGWGSIAA
jgi:hypothetical protein